MSKLFHSLVIQKSSSLLESLSGWSGCVFPLSSRLKPFSNSRCQTWLTLYINCILILNEAKHRIQIWQTTLPWKISFPFKGFQEHKNSEAYEIERNRLTTKQYLSRAAVTQQNPRPCQPRYHATQPGPTE